MFVGGCTLEAIEAVCRVDLDVLEGVASLIEKNLLRQEEGAGGEPRFRMLETVHEYARERLEGSGEAAAIHRQHAAYYLAFAEEAERQLPGPTQVVWLDRVETEHDNLRSAAWWLAEHEAVEQALWLAGGLWWFWEIPGRRSQGRDLLAALLEAPGAAARTAGRAKALLGVGLLATWGGDVVARALLEESLAIARALGDRQGVAYALLGLGEHALEQVDTTAARAVLKESLAMFRAVGDQWGSAWAGASLGYAIWDHGEGDIVAARTLLEESLAIRRALGPWQVT